MRDPLVEESSKRNDDLVDTNQRFIEARKTAQSALEEEAAIIRCHSAEFAAFLKKNSIIPYNDAYKDYLQHLIREEVAFLPKLKKNICRLQKSAMGRGHPVYFNNLTIILINTLSK